MSHGKAPAVISALVEDGVARQMTANVMIKQREVHGEASAQHSFTGSYIEAGSVQDTSSREAQLSAKSYMPIARIQAHTVHTIIVASM